MSPGRHLKLGQVDLQGRFLLILLHFQFAQFVQLGYAVCLEFEVRGEFPMPLDAKRNLHLAVRWSLEQRLANRCHSHWLGIAAIHRQHTALGQARQDRLIIVIADTMTSDRGRGRHFYRLPPDLGLAYESYFTRKSFLRTLVHQVRGNGTLPLLDLIIPQPDPLRQVLGLNLDRPVEVATSDCHKSNRQTGALTEVCCHQLNISLVLRHRYGLWMNEQLKTGGLPPNRNKVGLE